MGPNDERALERCWGAIPYDRFAAFVTANLDLWDQCIDRGADLTELAHYHHLQSDFRADIRATAQQYLATNGTVIAGERERLGIPAGGTDAPPPTAAQDEELRQLQSAAGTIAALERAQEVARKAYVGWKTGDLGDYDPEFTGRTGKFQVQFDPAEPPPLREEPADLPLGQLFRYKMVDWQALRDHYDRATQMISLLTALYPAAYALARTGKSEDSESFAKETNPAQARARLGAALTKLEADMARARAAVADTSSDLDLDITPLHEQLFAGTAPVGAERWKSGVASRAAHELVRDHDVSKALTRLLLQEVQELAFLIAPFTGGASLIAVLAVGAAASGASFALSAREYERLSSVQRVGVTPGTDLVTDAAVANAQQMAEGDAAAFALAAFALGAAAVGEIGAGRPRAPGGPGGPEVPGVPGAPGSGAGAAGVPGAGRGGVYTLLATDAQGSVYTAEQMTSMPFKSHPNYEAIKNELASLDVALVETADLAAREGATGMIGRIEIVGPTGETVVMTRLQYAPAATAQDIYHELNHLADYRAGRLPAKVFEAADAEEFARLRATSFDDLARRRTGPPATMVGRLKSLARLSVEEIRNHLRDIDEFALTSEDGRTVSNPDMEWFKEQQLEKMESNYVRSIRSMMRDAKYAEFRDEIADYVRNCVNTTWPELPGEFSRLSRGGRDFWDAIGVPAQP